MDSFNSKPKEESIIPISESFNFNQDQEDIFESSLHSSSNKKIKIMKNKNDINYYNDIDVDPNFRDIKLKKEEEARRRKEVEEFEKRKLQKYKDNNIIDYDESSEKKNLKNKDDIQVDDEGIIIDNFNYTSKTKINNINYKNSLCKKNNINNNINNEIEDYESKITQIKHLSSYSKDDLNINISPDKLKKDNIKFKNFNLINNANNKVDIIKESEINDINEISTHNNIDNNESNYEMNFYDTFRKGINENSKNSTGTFESLLPNKSLEKFLKEKLKYYMDEKDIPRNFINNLYLGMGIGEKPYSNGLTNFNQNLKSLDNGKLNFNYYSNENTSKTNINKNNSKNYIKPKEIKRNKSMDIFQRNKINYNSNSNQNNFNKTNKNSNSFKKVFIENKINKKKLEEMKKELSEQKNEMNEKLQKINLLENINDNLKQEMNILQKNFENERIDNTQNRKNYAIIKNCYNDIKNQYDLLNMKYMTLNDENFNFRRNKELYERQIALKNEMIENLIENKTNLQKQKINDEINKINFSTKSSHKIISTFLQNNKEDNKSEEKSDNNNIKKQSNRTNKKNEIDYSKYDKLSFPELQCKRDELTNERKDINNIYSKIPLKTNNRELINKKNNLEKRLKELNCELMLVKLSIKNYKNHK